MREGSIDNQDLKNNSQRKMPSASPTFKHLSEIFAMMERSDFVGEPAADQTRQSIGYEQPPIVHMQLTDRWPQCIEVRKRHRGARGGSIVPIDSNKIQKNIFDNSKLGVKANETQQQRLQHSRGIRNRRVSSQIPQDRGKILKSRENNSVQRNGHSNTLCNNGDPNNIQNRFFSLRRQRDRKQEMMFFQQ